MRSYECVWELPTGVICGLPEWHHDGRKILHPYCAPEGKEAADRRAARIADVAAIVTAYHAAHSGDEGFEGCNCDLCVKLRGGRSLEIEEWATAYVARESEGQP